MSKNHVETPSASNLRAWWLGETSTTKPVNTGSTPDPRTVVLYTKGCEMNWLMNLINLHPSYCRTILKRVQNVHLRKKTNIEVCRVYGVNFLSAFSRSIGKEAVLLLAIEEVISSPFCYKVKLSCVLVFACIKTGSTL